MREEKVTINILRWLEENNWKIICYDFPQSGTGILLHPNRSEVSNNKNKGGIIPDIIAVKNSIALYFENKDRFVLSDFDKINDIKTSNNYSDSISTLLSNNDITNIYYGIGIPAIEKHMNKSKENISKIDFLVSVLENGSIQINYDKYDILK